MLRPQVNLVKPRAVPVPGPLAEPAADVPAQSIKNPAGWLVAGMTLVALVTWGLVYYSSALTTRQVNVLTAGLSQARAEVAKLQSAQSRQPPPARKAVHRLSNDKTKDRLYIAAPADIDAAVKAGYHDEGIAFYAY